MVPPKPFGLVELTRIRRSFRLAAALAALSLLVGLLAPLAAFAQDDEEGEPPAGDYTVAITEDDIPSDLVNGPDLIGRWQIFLRPDASYVLRRADIGEVVTGTYTIDGETIAITDESGLLSCVNAVPTGGEGVPTDTGTYNWEVADDDGLTLRPIEEACAARELILSTRPLDVFIACDTEALPIPPPVTEEDEGDEETSDDTAPTDEDEATEDDEEAVEGEQEAEDAVQPDDEGDEEDEGIDDPFGGGDDEEDGGDEGDGEDVEPDEEEVEDGIDGVLGQLSACWTTQDPARILPLFGEEFLTALTEDAGSLYDVAGIFGQIMAIPITWERAGEVELEGTQANALVSQTIGAEESFVRFLFVFEDGEWKLGNFGV